MYIDIDRDVDVDIDIDTHRYRFRYIVYHVIVCVCIYLYIYNINILLLYSSLHSYNLMISNAIHHIECTLIHCKLQIMKYNANMMQPCGI